MKFPTNSKSMTHTENKQRVQRSKKEGKYDTIHYRHTPIPSHYICIPCPYHPPKTLTMTNVKPCPRKGCSGGLFPQFNSYKNTISYRCTLCSREFDKDLVERSSLQKQPDTFTMEQLDSTFPPVSRYTQIGEYYQ